MFYIFKFSSVTSFLFVIIVCAIDDVFPVFLTLYPASSSSFFAFSILLLSPDPFSNSMLMSSAVCVVVVVLMLYYLKLCYLHFFCYICIKHRLYYSFDAFLSATNTLSPFVVDTSGVVPGSVADVIFSVSSSTAMEYSL